MARLRRRGFTLMEILIAIVVLVLGITGIVALFPTAIDSGNQTVEDTYASEITLSVVDAVTVGIRESRYVYKASAASRAWNYFVFNHDGVQDEVPPAPHDYTSSPPDGSFHTRDYAIVLPQALNLGATGQGGGLGPVNNTNVAQEPVFIYPVPLVGHGGATENNQRAPARLDAGQAIDNFNVNRRRFSTKDTETHWIPRVYPLGVYRRGQQPTGAGAPAAGDTRLEFLSNDNVYDGTGGGQRTIAVDPYPHYSFAFSFQRARIDTNNDARIDTNDEFSESLYQLKVFVFKNFDQAEADAIGPDPTRPVPRGNVPRHEFVTLISL
ncbi:MAG: prepilin-type N-terminal cleavage/methylation domain-containing protein [Planctomycetes bacterium]|nr:prepilin-type N-terminal cleavage/methylation domain-containing protein [Planctomycetota bacterium]